MSHEIDESSTTSVAVCKERGCGWRGLALSYTQALRRTADHERNVHPRVFSAREQLRVATKVSTG